MTNDKVVLETALSSSEPPPFTNITSLATIMHWRRRKYVTFHACNLAQQTHRRRLLNSTRGLLLVIPTLYKCDATARQCTVVRNQRASSCCWSIWRHENHETDSQIVMSRCHILLFDSIQIIQLIRNAPQPKVNCSLVTTISISYSSNGAYPFYDMHT